MAAPLQPSCTRQGETQHTHSCSCKDRCITETLRSGPEIGAMVRPVSSEPSPVVCLEWAHCSQINVQLAVVHTKPQHAFGLNCVFELPAYPYPSSFSSTHPPSHRPSCRSPCWCCQGVLVCPAATWSHLNSWRVWGGRSSSTTRYEHSLTPATTACTMMWAELLLHLLVPCFN